MKERLEKLKQDIDKFSAELDALRREVETTLKIMKESDELHRKSNKCREEVVFYHFRIRDPIDYKEVLPNGGLTFAVKVKEHYDSYLLKVAVAICSEKDNFSRKIGRELALRRLEDGMYFDMKSESKHEIRNLLLKATRDQIKRLYGDVEEITGLKKMQKKYEIPYWWFA